jgi:eukaryotic-like serine/threonine-protein kinase
MSGISERLTNALADRYHIERELGAGGMATVYLAHDIRHDRKVALKVLRPELAAIIGADRFLSEIRTTANLQHPHILPLFDSGAADGFLFYVMPFIQGETVRDRMNREKQLPVADALRIATEIAAALDYAHRHGVIHRDIKPENILLHDGSALVADFGIALAASNAGGTRMTETGMSLGTPHYMSPEQAMGEREITLRSDVYALGCVLYEMLTGDPPFTGSTAQAIVARVLTDVPRAMVTQRHTIPRHVEAAVLTALEKLPADRFASAAEFATALADHSYGAKGPDAHANALGGTPRAWRSRIKDPITISFAVVTLVSLVAAIAQRKAPPPGTLPPIRFVFTATDSTKPVNNFPWPAAISPDGSQMIYSVAHGSANSLYVLRTDQLDARPIPGTTDAGQPYFSPDGQWVAFEAGGKERKVRLDGSAPVAIVDANGANGADWLIGDVIVLGAQGHFHGLSRVSAAGGVAVALTRPDSAQGEQDHLWPIGTPDGRSVVFTVWSGTLATSRLSIASLKSGRAKSLGISGIRSLAVLDDMLVYVRADGAVMAVSIDARKQRVTGEPIPVLDPIVVYGANNGNSDIFISRGGALVTAQGGARGTLAWLSAQGEPESVLAQPRNYQEPRLSPDERRISIILRDGANSDLWIYDRALATFSRLTSSGTVTTAEWSADGERLIFSANGDSARAAVWSQAVSGGSAAVRLFENTALTPMATLSPDGKSLLINTLYESSWDILRVGLDSALVARNYIATSAQETAPQFSANGKWVAFVSTESGREEVYVRSFPDPSARIQISVTGGTEPLWSKDGGRLYYRSGQAIMAARVTFTPTFTLLGRDTIMGRTKLLTNQFRAPSFDVSRDGRVLATIADSDDMQLVVSPNWINEFRRRVAESGKR